jgi:hypothetical protein
MNYWITTQWPPRVDESENVHSGVYLPHGRQDAGRDLKPGDLIFIYESKTGRTKITKDLFGNATTIKTRNGREGVVCLLRAKTGIMEDFDELESKYTDGSTEWWKWYADTEPIRETGFVPRTKVNAILRYKPNYLLRAFGDEKSGLKKITKEQFTALLSEYLSSTSPITTTPIISTSSKKRKWKAPVESSRHMDLKLYIANNPEKALGETGIQTIKVEYEFPTSDQADIILKDKYDRIIGLEVEVDVLPNQLAGVLQAVKYKYMAAIMYKRTFQECRSILVAYSICDDIKHLCKKYDVQCIEIGSINQ